MSGKYIHRAEKNRCYTIIDNGCLNDSRLSNKAKGLFAQMLSKPDHWIFHNDEIQTWSTDGREAVASAMKELQKYGYVARVRRRGEDGKFIYETHVYEIPLTENPSTDKPLTENPSTDKPLADEPSTENLQLVSTDKASTEKVNNIVQQIEPLFDSWWNLYAKKIGRAKCEPVFKKLLKKYSYPVIEEGTKSYLQYLQQTNTPKKFQKNPLTFLNGEHFRDEYELELIEQPQQSSYPPRLESADTIDFSKGEDW